MEQIKKYIPLIAEGYTIEFYINRNPEAGTTSGVLVLISPNSIETHIDINMETVPLLFIAELTSEYEIDVIHDGNHAEPQSVHSTNQSDDKYENTNSFDEQYSNLK